MDIFAKLEYEEGRRPHTVGRPRFADVHNKQLLGKSISRFCSSEIEAVRRYFYH